MAPQYRYRARDDDGRNQSGVITGHSPEDAARRLAAGGLYPVDIEMAGARKTPFISVPVLFSKVPEEERIVFTRQFATLIKAGVPIISALESLCGQTESHRLDAAVRGVIGKLKAGRPLSEAMGGDMEIFPEVYTAMVASGETSGSLDDSLDNIAAMLERDHELKTRIREITRYPKIVMTAALFAVAVLLALVIPRYAAIFEKTGMALPLPTRALIWINEIFHAHWLDGVEAAVMAAVLLRLALASAGGRLFFDDLSLRAPGTGGVALRLALARWANTLGSLLKAGVPILSALAISRRAAGNERVAAFVGEAAEDVRDGAGLAAPMARDGFAPPVVARMIASGESAGALDEMLMRVSSFLEDDAQRRIRRLTVFFESGLIVAVALMVGFLALSVFLPMWDITALARRG